MRQSIADVFLKAGEGRQGERLTKLIIVVLQDPNQCIALRNGEIRIFGITGIEKSRDLQVSFSSEKIIVRNCFRYAAGRQNRMELLPTAQHQEILLDVGNDLLMMLMIIITVIILGTRNKVLNTFDIFTGCITIPNHWAVVHVVIEFSLLCRIGKHFPQRGCLSFLKPNSLTDISLIKGRNHVGVKAEDVLIADTVSNAIAVKLIAENIFCSKALMSNFFMYWCSCKTKEHGHRERIFDDRHHLSEGRAMALIDDKDQPLLANLLNIAVNSDAGLDVAHLLDRGNDQRIRRLIALQPGDEFISIFR